MAREQGTQPARLETASKDTSVIVGCKLPHGLHMDVDGKRVTLLGTNASQIIGGYGLTRVDRSFAEKWFAQHNDADYIRKGFVFFQERLQDAKSQAKERAKELNGFEGINAQAPGPGVEPADARTVERQLRDAATNALVLDEA